MKSEDMPSGWIHYAFWAFDRGLARARKGLFGQRAEHRSPSSLEEAVFVSGSDARIMVIRTMVWSLASFVVLWPLLTAWFWGMEYIFHFGVSLDTVWTIYNAGRVTVGLADALLYIWFVLGPFQRSLRGLKDARQAVLALESMPAQERSSWVGEYRSAERPACRILERRSPIFRSLVGSEETA